MKEEQMTPEQRADLVAHLTEGQTPCEVQKHLLLGGNTWLF